MGKIFDTSKLEKNIKRENELRDQNKRDAESLLKELQSFTTPLSERYQQAKNKVVVKKRELAALESRVQELQSEYHNADFIGDDDTANAIKDEARNISRIEIPNARSALEAARDSVSEVEEEIAEVRDQYVAAMELVGEFLGTAGWFAAEDSFDRKVFGSNEQRANPYAEYIEHSKVLVS